MDRVPFDGYRAELHKNESVLTASESQEWRNYKSGKQNTAPIVIHYNPTIDGASGIDETKIMAILKSHAQELKQIVESVYRREAARSYA